MSFTEKTNRLLRLFSRKKKPKTAAVILAAGIGSRMKTADNVTKQFLMLDGKPLFMHSVLAFDASPYIDEIVLVVNRDELYKMRKAMKQCKTQKPFRMTVGGETRQISALRGMEAVSEDMAYIAVHDAARCLVTPEMIADVAAAAYASRAASAGCRVTDTVKVVSKDRFVEKTLDRNTLFRAQTPQIFETKLYRAAAYVALEKKENVTDDNQLVELLGHTVKMVDCGYENLKVTTQEDLYFAEAVLKMRRERQGKKA